MNIYKITQIVYLGPEQRRHEEIGYIRANREPTADEAQQKMHIQDTIMVQPANFDTWELP